MSMTSSDILRIQDVAASFDPDNSASMSGLVRVLDGYSAVLARSGVVRQNIGNSTNPSIWPVLRNLWDSTLRAHTRPDPNSLLVDACTSLAKFTRNLVAENAANQERALDNEPAIRKLIFNYTSYVATRNASSYAATRLLTQTLSNIITANDALAQRLWNYYLNLPEEQVILTRLFASPDALTVSCAFVFVLNCVHGSHRRTELLAASPRGPRICIALLDRLTCLFEAEESSEENHAFNIGYEIFSRVIEAGLAPKLYGNLAVEDELIAPHQTTLLKLVDSFLHHSDCAHELSLRRPEEGGVSLLDMLVHEFLALSAYAQASIRRTLGSQETDHVSPQLPELDLLLPKVCEALVLVTQCLTTIMLRVQETIAVLPVSPQVHADSAYGPITVASATFQGQGFVESLIETLRLVDAFVPRITYGKVTQNFIASDQEESQGTIQAKRGDSDDVTIDSKVIQAAQAFAHVKRDLVRLLGILASDSRAVQDRARECSGLPVVMNLCVIDDYNPYLREHAIFALRNLLHGNVESQAVVDRIKPVGKWDENRVLQKIPGSN